MQRIAHRGRELGWAAFVGSTYFLSAIVALRLSQGPGETATIWVPSGIVLGVLLLAPRRAYPQILLATAMASLFANLMAGVSASASAAYTLANVIEALFAVAMVGAVTSGGASFADPRAVRRFAVIALVSSIASTIAVVLLTGQFGREFAGSWFMTVLLGQLIFAPLLVTIRRQIGGFFGHGDTRQYAAEAAILGLVVITTLAVFLQSEVPLLFLSVPPILFATYRFGPIGAALSVFIVAVIGSVATLNGIGPCAAFSTHGISSITFLQIYLVTLLISALPLAAALSARNASYEELMRQKGFFEMASQTAHIGHWRLEIAEERLTWSDEVYRIHGLPIGTPPPLSEAINAYHPDDRGMVSLWLDDCIANGGEFEFDARIVTTGGDVRHVNSRGRADVDGNGEVVALFGVFQDVTQRVHVNQQLDIARMQAEAEARHSRILAETDQLTGVANRRRAMAEFETAVACAQVGGADLVVAVLDVDHFKFVNDTHGHAMGDMVLRQVAEIGAGCLRSTDTFGRIGGEEFLLVLPGANLETAKFVAERIRTRVMEIAVDNPAIPPITTSIGMATYQPGMSVEAIFQAADRALYEAKNSGRNLLKVA